METSDAVRDEGNLIHRNVWLKLGFSPEQARQLKELAKRKLKPGHQRSSLMAWYLLNTVLANIELVEDLLARDVREAQATKDSCECLWRNKTRARQLNLN